MEVSQKLNTAETQLLLAGLDLITIKGSHAKVVANLQVKLEKAQQTIIKRIEQEEEKKEKSFQETVKR
jgi:hypothetical protein